MSRAKRYISHSSVSPVKISVASDTLSATRKMLLTCIIERGENLSTNVPPSSMKKTVGTPLTAITTPTARGSPVTSKTSQGNAIRSNWSPIADSPPAPQSRRKLRMRRSCQKDPFRCASSTVVLPT